MKNMKILLFLLLLLISGFSVLGATVTNVNLGYDPSTPSPNNDLLVTYSLNLEGSESAAKAVFDWKKNGVSWAKLNMPFEVRSCAGGICTTKDYSSNGNTGTEKNGVSWVYNSGYDGWGAYNFDGTDDYIEIADSSSLDLNQFTLEARINPDVLGGYHTIISKHVSPNRPPSLWLGGTGGSHVQVWIGGSAVATSVSSLSTGTWYHLAATYDGSNIKIYINGNLDQTVAYSTTPPNNDQPLFIGQRGDSLYWFDGKIDEVRVYNFALSADQVADHNGGNPDDRKKAQTPSGELWKVTISPIGRAGTFPFAPTEGTSVTSNELNIPYLLIACKTSGWVSGGFYSLQSDATTTGSCMVIDASNVELSCNGHVLDGDDSGTTDYGVDVNGNLDNIIVKGCTIQDFAHGLNVVGGGSVTEADNLKFENNVVQSNTRYGAKASYTNNALFAGNTFTGLASGGWSYLYLDTDNDDVLAQGNTFNHPLSISGQSLMVSATTNDNVDVIGNTFTNPGSTNGVGLGISDADGLDVHNNVIQGYGYGVYFYNDADNSVFYNNDFKTKGVIHAYRANSFSNGNVFDSGGVGNYWDDYDTAAEGCNDVSPANGVCDAALNTANAPWNQVNPIVDNFPWTTAQN